MQFPEDEYMNRTFKNNNIAVAVTSIKVLPQVWQFCVEAIWTQTSLLACLSANTISVLDMSLLL